MPRSGRCRCGFVLKCHAGPDGYKMRCPQCHAVVRLRPSARVWCTACGVSLDSADGELPLCEQCQKKVPAIPEIPPPLPPRPILPPGFTDRETVIVEVEPLVPPAQVRSGRGVWIGVVVGVAVLAVVAIGVLIWVIRQQA